MLLQSRIIAVDFDGTIVENKYPKIGKPLPFAFETLKMLQNDGHRLILWTVRTGELLEAAVKYCKKNGIEFYAVNEDFPGEISQLKNRKLNADLFIDDRNVGGMLEWGQIYQLISETAPAHAHKKKKWWSR